VRSIEHGSLIGRRGDRADEAARHLAGRRHLQRRLHRHRRPRSRAGRQDILRKNTETTRRQREASARRRRGVNIAYGTDSGVYPHGDNARQFAYMVRYGMTPMQAIQSATIQSRAPARREGELGSIAPGKVADLIAVEAIPSRHRACCATYAP
jgi:imidazolonepropionase-like amidohydrolase